jgi:hypothetical protein
VNSEDIGYGLTLGAGIIRRHSTGSRAHIELSNAVLRSIRSPQAIGCATYRRASTWRRWSEDVVVNRALHTLEVKHTIVCPKRIGHVMSLACIVSIRAAEESEAHDGRCIQDVDSWVREIGDGHEERRFFLLPLSAFSQRPWH